MTAPILRPIPSTGEQLPAIGLGSWQTFDVGDPPHRAARLHPAAVPTEAQRKQIVAALG